MAWLREFSTPPNDVHSYILTLTFTFLKKVADTAFGDRPRERARWAFRWLSRLNEVIAKGLATQLIGQTQYLRQQVERLR